MSSLVRIAISGTVCLAFAAPAFATNQGEEGCTPGYWKNHTEDWLETEAGDPSYAPTDLFGDVFGVDYDVTLIDALQGGGGRGIEGAQKVLARSATAALLNAAHEGIGYPLSRYFETEAGEPILASVQDVWDSGDRDAILDLAVMFDELNNLGCPL
jgi:hypothetical protein